MKPYYPLHPLAFHLRFPQHLKSKVKKKRFRGRKIIYDYTHMDRFYGFSYFLLLDVL